MLCSQLCTKRCIRMRSRVPRTLRTVESERILCGLVASGVNGKRHSLAKTYRVSPFRAAYYVLSSLSPSSNRAAISKWLRAVAAVALGTYLSVWTSCINGASRWFTRHELCIFGRYMNCGLFGGLICEHLGASRRDPGLANRVSARSRSRHSPLYREQSATA